MVCYMCLHFSIYHVRFIVLASIVYVSYAFACVLCALDSIICFVCVVFVSISHEFQLCVPCSLFIFPYYGVRCRCFHFKCFYMFGVYCSSCFRDAHCFVFILVHSFLVFNCARLFMLCGCMCVVCLCL